MTRQLRVNHHVAYIRPIDSQTEPSPSYVSNYVKRRPATITAFDEISSNPNLRIRHHNEIYLDVPEKTSPEQVEVYVPH